MRFYIILFIKGLRQKTHNLQDQKTHVLTTRVFFKQICNLSPIKSSKKCSILAFSQCSQLFQGENYPQLLWMKFRLFCTLRLTSISALCCYAAYWNFPMIKSSGTGCSIT